jgi:hypothetical protein
MLDPTLRPIVIEINRQQAAGDDMHYSMHIYRGIRWRLNFTPDIATTKARISDLRHSLTQPVEQKLAGEQQASDGSWGLGIDAWYLKLYYSVDRANECRPPPKYPLSFLDQINSPEKLDAQLDSDLRNDFTKREYSTAKNWTKHSPRWPGYFLRLHKQGATHFILNSKILCVHLSSAGRILQPDAGDSGWWIGKEESGKWTTWR